MKWCQFITFAILLIANQAFSQQNGVLTEVWNQLDGTSVADLRNSRDFPQNPVYRYVAPNFSTTRDWSDRYGVRMRALLVPAATADYTFWVSGDDNCELWLSTDESEAESKRIARVPNWTAAESWFVDAEQMSSPVRLELGKRYYIEALMKEGYGGDSLSVAWAKSPTDKPVIVSGDQLIPIETPTASSGLLVKTSKELKQYLPNTSVVAVAQTWNVSRPNATPSVLWTQVSGPPAVIASPNAASTRIECAEVGTYVFRATASSSGLTAYDQLVVKMGNALDASSGGALAEYWFGVPGAAVANGVANVDFPSYPHAYRNVNTLQLTQSVGEQYFSRTRGYLVAPETGYYRFYLSANEFAECWLSPDSSAAGLQKIVSPTVVANTVDVMGHRSQRSELIWMTQGQRRAFEIRHKEDWGSDFCVLRWQLPNRPEITEITQEFLVPPQDAIDVMAKTRSLNLDVDYLVYAGRDQVIYLPQQQISLNAVETRRIWGSDSPTREWRMLSGPAAVQFANAGGAQTTVTFAQTGTYVLQYRVTTLRNTTVDEIKVEVRPALASGTGALTRQIWRNRNYSDFVSLRKDPAFSQFPDIVDQISEFRQSENWSSTYATRVTGILQVPADEPSDYVFYVSGDDAVEFSISTDETPSQLQLICFATKATGKENWTNEASQISSPISLKPGGKYFVELLHRQSWGADYFAVAWSRKGDRLPRILNGSFFTTTQSAPPFQADLAYYVNAGKDRVYYWPHQRIQLQGSLMRMRSTASLDPKIKWRQLSGPSAQLTNDDQIQAEFLASAAGRYEFELSVTDGEKIHRDVVQINLLSPIAENSGYLTRSVWLNVPGASVADLLAVDAALSSPTFEDSLPGAELPRDWADAYATRLKGYLTVPVEGDYTLWIAADDASQLKLDRLDGQGLRTECFVSAYVGVREWDRISSQKSVSIRLRANVPYPIEILHKESTGGDHCAVAMDGPATNGRELLSRAFLRPDHAAAAFEPEMTVVLGKDRELLWPDDRLTLAALVYDLQPGVTKMQYEWSCASADVKLLTPVDMLTEVRFARPGVYQLHFRVSDGVNVVNSSVHVTVRDPLSENSGGLLREVWMGLDGYDLTSLRQRIAQRKPPQFVELLRGMETPSSWADFYGQRLSGFLQVPEDGDYVFAVASDDDSELWLNPDGDDEQGLKKIAEARGATGRYQWTSRPGQKSQPQRLKAGVRYRVLALHEEGAGDDYFAVAYKRAADDDQSLIVIPRALLSPPSGQQIVANDSSLSVQAGEDRCIYWPTKQFTLRAIAVDGKPGPQPLSYRWSIVRAPDAAMNLKRVFDAANAATTVAEFPAPGDYVVQVMVSDGENTRSDNLTISIKPPVAAGTGGLLAERFDQIAGNWVNDMLNSAKYPSQPSSRYLLRSSETSVNTGDEYGLRIRGYLHPPKTGWYRFNIASDDWSEMYLSPNRSIEEKELMCFVPSATGIYEWRKMPEYQLSRPVLLTQGQAYYIELRYKEGGWRDHLEWAWLRPDQSEFDIIDGAFFSPWKLSDAEAPTASLVGPATMNHMIGTDFVDPGVSAVDAVDGDISPTVRVEGRVDVQTPGTYVLRYQIMDRSGNVANTLQRRVTVSSVASRSATYADDQSVVPDPRAWQEPRDMSAIEASRFLKQATLGASMQDIQQVQSAGIAKWIDGQFAIPATSHLATMDRMGLFAQAQSSLLRSTTNTGGLPGSMMPLPVSANTNDRLWTWWTLAASSPDQLRQRVALALSEIFVISDKSGVLRNYPRGCAHYYDLLARALDEGKTYRQLLEEITLNPMMGTWLTMVRSSKLQPDENYPRELMQLFSIGLNQLNRDGSLKLDANLRPLPTYTQKEILELSRAFTGWTYSNSAAFQWAGDAIDEIAPMMPFEEFHDRGEKIILGGASIPAGQTAIQDVRRALDVISEHPNVPPFISRLLIQRLVTSNPSPAYIYRVSRVFENNGQGVRGDMRAVVKAILLDAEARETNAANFSGKLSEPMIRVSRLLRAFPLSPSDNPPVFGRYMMANYGDDLGQWPMQALTVFNFFRPDYQFSGALADSGKVAPEFEISTELTVTDTANYFYDGVTYGFSVNQGSRLKLNVNSLIASWNQPTDLLQQLEILLLAKPMSQPLRDALMAMHRLYVANPTEGVTVMLQLLTATPDFVVEK